MVGQQVRSRKIRAISNRLQLECYNHKIQTHLGIFLQIDGHIQISRHSHGQAPSPIYSPTTAHTLLMMQSCR